MSQHPRFLCLRPTLILYSFRVSPKLAERVVRATDSYFAPFLLPPHITAVSGGGVQFEWHRGVRELEIEFGLIDDGGLPVEYLRVSHGERFNDGVVESTSELLGHLNWIIGG